MLTPYVPDFEIHVGHRDCRDILSDCWNRFQVGGWSVREEEGFDLFVEGGFASIIEAEEEDGIFCHISVKFYRF